MTLELVRSLDVTAVIGISGHAGCGHAHSHCGFVQDDSGGLAAVLAHHRTGLDDHPRNRSYRSKGPL